MIVVDGLCSLMCMMMGFESCGCIFKDCFLIVDVKMKVEFLIECWFWFDLLFYCN